MGRRGLKLTFTYLKNHLQNEYFSFIILYIIFLENTLERKNKIKQGKPHLSAKTLDGLRTDKWGYRKPVNTHGVYLQTNNLQKCYMFIVLQKL